MKKLIGPLLVAALLLLTGVGSAQAGEEDECVEFPGICAQEEVNVPEDPVGTTFPEGDVYNPFEEGEDGRPISCPPAPAPCANIPEGEYDPFEENPDGVPVSCPPAPAPCANGTPEDAQADDAPEDHDPGPDPVEPSSEPSKTSTHRPSLPSTGV